ncbi:MAG: hypothetical protein ACRETQ_00205 [Gammaproteobacteria bacterium]
MFRRKKRVRSMIAGAQAEIFRAYGVLNPPNAQKMKAYVYICIAGIGILNGIGGEGLRDVISKIVWETKELAKSLQSVRVENLANDRKELEDILTDFPEGVVAATTVNGLAAFDALYRTKVKRLVIDNSNQTGNKWLMPGYAAIVVGDGIFGEGKYGDHYVELEMAVNKFMRALATLI